MVRGAAIPVASAERNSPRRCSALQPAVTLLKPLKGCDEHTEACLRSWLAQDYAGEIQALFAVGNADDPACALVKKLLAEFPQRDAQLVVCPERLGANAKVSQLAQLEPHARHEVIIVSDADVRAPADLVANVVAPLRDEKVGLVSCFYRLANPTTPAMRWEAIAINADFWSQVLQGASFRKLDFALGAVMVTRRKQLTEIGGFRTFANCLADDYQLGNRIARHGHRIELCPVVVDCWSEPMGWGAVWKHQLRWARTIRVCQPLPYFFSILSNATLWPLLWLLAARPAIVIGMHTSDAGGTVVSSLYVPTSAIVILICLIVRVVTALNLQHRLTRLPVHFSGLGLVLLKDLLQALIWAGSFAGNRIEWRGEQYRLRRDGTLEKSERSVVS
jgi:ceramide glucosyltransferase